MSSQTIDTQTPDADGYLSHRQILVVMGGLMAPMSKLSLGLIPPLCPPIPSLAQLLDPGAIGASSKMKLDKMNAPKRKQAVEELKGADCHYWPEAEEALIAGRIGTMTMAEITSRFADTAMCWGQYRTVRGALQDDPRLSGANPLFAAVSHPSGETYLTPGFPGSVMSAARRTPVAAPMLGAHTDEILGDVLGLSAAEIGALHDAGLVASAD